MNNIYQGCILDLLEKHGHIPEYVDSHQINAVTYYFGGIGGWSIKFTHSCVPADVAGEYLALFGLQVNMPEMWAENCLCDW